MFRIVFLLLMGMALLVSPAVTVATPVPVVFFVVDDDHASGGGDNLVRLSVLDWPLSNQVQYSLNAEDWFSIPVAGNISVSTGSDHYERVYFRHLNGSNPPVSAADLFFTGPEGASLWNSVLIAWAGFPATTFVSPGDNDNVSPVPVPSTLLLLGTGLFGFLFFRRKRNHH